MATTATADEGVGKIRQGISSRLGEQTRRADESIASRLKSTLDELGYAEARYLFDDLWKQIDTSRRRVGHKVEFYKWSGFVVFLFLPLLATLLSFLITDSGKELFGLFNRANYVDPCKIIVSFTVTILTLFNSIFRPGARFKESCRLGIQLAHFRYQALRQIAEKVHVPAGEVEVIQTLNDLDEQLEPLQTEEINLFLPVHGLEANGKNGTSQGNGKGQLKEPAAPKPAGVATAGAAKN